MEGCKGDEEEKKLGSDAVPVEVEKMLGYVSIKW